MRLLASHPLTRERVAHEVSEGLFKWCARRRLLRGAALTRAKLARGRWPALNERCETFSSARGIAHAERFLRFAGGSEEPAVLGFKGFSESDFTNERRATLVPQQPTHVFGVEKGLAAERDVSCHQGSVSRSAGSALLSTRSTGPGLGSGQICAFRVVSQFGLKTDRWLCQL